MQIVPLSCLRFSKILSNADAMPNILVIIIQYTSKIQLGLKPLDPLLISSIPAFRVHCGGFRQGLSVAQILDMVEKSGFRSKTCLTGSTLELQALLVLALVAFSDGLVI